MPLLNKYVCDVCGTIREVKPSEYRPMRVVSIQVKFSDCDLSPEFERSRCFYACSSCTHLIDERVAHISDAREAK